MKAKEIIILILLALSFALAGASIRTDADSTPTPDPAIIASGDLNQLGRVFSFVQNDDSTPYTFYTAVGFDINSQLLGIHETQDDYFNLHEDIRELTTHKVISFLGNASSGFPRFFSPDGRLLGIISPDNSFKVFNIVTGETERLFKDIGANELFAFSWDDQLLAVYGYGGSGKLLQIISLSTTQTLKVLSYDIDDDTVNFPKSIVFSPDNHSLIIGGTKGNIILLDIKSGNQVNEFFANNLVDNLTISPTGNLLVASGCTQMSSDTSNHYSTGGHIGPLCVESRAVFWDLRTQQSLRSLDFGGYPGILIPTFSPDGKSLVLYNSFATVDHLSLWRVIRGKLATRIKRNSAL